MKWLRSILWFGLAAFAAFRGVRAIPDKNAKKAANGQQPPRRRRWFGAGILAAIALFAFKSAIAASLGAMFEELLLRYKGQPVSEASAERPADELMQSANALLVRARTDPTMGTAGVCQSLGEGLSCCR